MNDLLADRPILPQLVALPVSLGSGAIVVQGAGAHVFLVVLAPGGGLIAYYLWNAGVRKIGASSASVFINLVPVASMLISTMGLERRPCSLVCDLLGSQNFTLQSTKSLRRP